VVSRIFAEIAARSPSQRARNAFVIAAYYRGMNIAQLCAAVCAIKFAHNWDAEQSNASRAFFHRD
jgi:GR25 family glycosyltransferase involved in LPS biosynthesis